jgi:PHD/YefM family antitoxin component YafN of YafNO toxin-antitoxin module
METVSSGEFQRKIGHYQDRALVEPVTITSNGRERLVMGLEDFTEADLEALRKVRPSKAAEAFNHEVAE